MIDTLKTPLTVLRPIVCMLLNTLFYQVINGPLAGMGYAYVIPKFESLLQYWSQSKLDVQRDIYNG